MKSFQFACRIDPDFDIVRAVLQPFHILPMLSPSLQYFNRFVKLRRRAESKKRNVQLFGHLSRDRARSDVVYVPGDSVTPKADDQRRRVLCGKGKQLFEEGRLIGFRSQFRVRSPGVKRSDTFKNLDTASSSFFLSIFSCPDVMFLFMWDFPFSPNVAHAT